MDFNLGLAFNKDCYPIIGDIELCGENKSFFVCGKFEIRWSSECIYVNSNKWIREPDSKNTNGMTTVKISEERMPNYYCNYKLFLDKNLKLTKGDYEVRAIQGRAKINPNFNLAMSPENSVDFSILPVNDNKKNIVYNFILAED